MSRGLIASPQSHTVFSTSHIPLITPQRRCSVIPPISRINPLLSSNLNPSGFPKFPRINLLCNSSGDSGENESKTVLDAFFLGKAVGEVLNERIESTLGEFLSVIGRLQAEQRKQVSEFREVVLEKARRAKEEASREATSLGISTANGVSETTSSVSNSVISAASSKVSNEDPLMGMFNKD